MKDWYDYLTKDFRVARAEYRVNHRAVVLCPRCLTTQVIRINHLKSKIKKLGYYECAKCRKSDGAKLARSYK